jgi:hypothetical protein
MRRRGRRRKQPLDDLKEKEGYWNFKKETSDCTLWRAQFGRDLGGAVKPDYALNVLIQLHSWKHFNTFLHIRVQFIFRYLLHDVTANDDVGLQAVDSPQ